MRKLDLEAVTFDCWGTLLVDFDAASTRAARLSLLRDAGPRGVEDAAVEAALNAAWTRHHHAWESGEHSGAFEIARDALAALGVPEDDDRATDLAVAFSRAALESDVRPVPGARDGLAALSGAGLRLGLICDTGFATGATVRKLLSRARLLDWFGALIFSDEWGVPKPHPRLFRAALTELDVTAPRAAHVGDLHRTDVLGAKRAGLVAIRLTTHYEDPHAGPEADFVIPSHEALVDLLLEGHDEADAGAAELATPDPTEASGRAALSASLGDAVTVEDAAGLWMERDGSFRWVPRPWSDDRRERQTRHARRAAALVGERAAWGDVHLVEVGEEPPLWALGGALPDPATRLDRVLAEGCDPERCLRAVAAKTAALHAKAARDDATAYQGTLEKLSNRIRRLVAQARRAGVDDDELARAEESLFGFVLQRSEALRARRLADRVRRCHGDLRPQYVFVDDAMGVRVLPPLLLDPEASSVDVAADVAGLAQRLSPPHGEAFCAAYAEASLDFGIYPVLEFHGRLSALRRLAWYATSRRLTEHPPSRALAAREIEVALDALRPAAARPAPLVVATGGQVGTGKSTVSRLAAEILGAPRIEVDALHERLIDEPPVEPVRRAPSERGGLELKHEAAWERSFAEGFAEAVYSDLFRQATHVLESGRSVVLDGCFGRRLFRNEARRRAEALGARFVFLECVLDPDVHRERLATRERQQKVPPGTWTDLAGEFAGGWEPVDTLPEADHHRLDTRTPPEALRARLHQLTTRRS